MINLTALLSEEPPKADGIRYSRGSSPSVLVWNVTLRCNLRCLHCYSAARCDGELSRDEAIQALRGFKEAGVKTILFSGGEPLLREDILELGEIASSLGILPALSTNGTLITSELARRIKMAGFSYVGISLDGLKGTNDRFRGRKGAFERAIRGLENTIKMGIKVGIRFTITKFNAAELFDLIDLADKMGVERFCVYHLAYSGRARPEHDLNRKQKRRLVERLIKKAKEMLGKGSKLQILTVTAPFDGVFLHLLLKGEDPEKAENVLRYLRVQGGEGSGSKLLRVDQLGWVYPNQFWERRLGNIRERRLAEIVSESPLLAALRERPRRLLGKCGACLFKEVCGGFRARADQVFGNPFEEDPACYLTWEEITTGGLMESEVGNGKMA